MENKESKFKLKNRKKEIGAIPDNCKELFSIMDIKKEYPSDIGIQNVFKQFINGNKIRTSKSAGILLKSSPGSPERKITISFYNPSRILSKFEDYLSSKGNTIDSFKINHMKTIVVLLKNKISENNLKKEVK